MSTVSKISNSTSLSQVFLSNSHLLNKYKTKNHNINYLTKYLKMDVAYVRARRYYHYYNDIPYTRWPFSICNALFFTLFYGVLFLTSGIMQVYWLFFLCFACYILSICGSQI